MKSHPDIPTSENVEWLGDPNIVSVEWLDRVVEVHQRIGNAHRLLALLSMLTQLYDFNVEEAFNRDGTHYRLQALQERKVELVRQLGAAQRDGWDVRSILIGVDELVDTAQQTLAATRALIEEAGSN